MDVCVFFFRSAHGHGPGAVPPLVNRGRTGLQPERNVASGESKPPPILSLSGGSPAARGRDNEGCRRTATEAREA
jgi:hypothetical protein